MTKDQLITKQQLEIEELKESNAGMKDDFLNIYMILHAVGAPLNDNLLNFNKEQSVPLFRISGIVKYNLEPDD